MKPKSARGVSILTSTIRPQHFHDILHNYARQHWPVKELIVILNKNDMSLAACRRRAKPYPNVRVYQLPERYSLGECLNFGVSKARYPYIAKFDDDDYYSPHYLTEAMHMFNNPRAHVVGKRSFFFYLPHRKKLLLRRAAARPFSSCPSIAGATIMFRKRLFPQVKFVRAAVGTDVRFLEACRNRGYRLYTTSPYNFAAIRRANRYSHTWQVSEQQLLAQKNHPVIRTAAYRTYVTRPLRRLVKLK